MQDNSVPWGARLTLASIQYVARPRTFHRCDLHRLLASHQQYALRSPFGFVVTEPPGGASRVVPQTGVWVLASSQGAGTRWQNGDREASSRTTLQFHLRVHGHHDRSYQPASTHLASLFRRQPLGLGHALRRLFRFRYFLLLGAWRERTVTSKITWFMLIMPLGSIAMSSYACCNFFLSRPKIPSRGYFARRLHER